MTLTKIADDLFIPENFADHHHYYADADAKDEYTGVTTVLKVLNKPALVQWAANEVVGYIKGNAEEAVKNLFYVSADCLEEARTAHRRKADKAAEHGTDAHALVEKWIRFGIEECDGRPEITFIINERIQSFIDWADQNVDRFLFAERPLHSHDLFVAGTADFAYIGKDGKRYIGDFKTSSGIWDEYWLQCAAYRMLAEHEGDEPYDGSVIVRLGKDGKFETKKMVEYETPRDAFLAALKIYRAMDQLPALVIN